MVGVRKHMGRAKNATLRRVRQGDAHVLSHAAAARGAAGGLVLPRLRGGLDRVPGGASSPPPPSYASPYPRHRACIFFFALGYASLSAQPPAPPRVHRSRSPGRGSPENPTDVSGREPWDSISVMSAPPPARSVGAARGASA